MQWFSWRVALIVIALGAPAILVGCASIAHGALSAVQPATPPLTIAVLGASDAWGVGSRDPDRLNWPSVMAADLERPVHLINLGAPGATLALAQREELPVALDARPDDVVVWLAVNDIIARTPLSAYASELYNTLRSLRARTPHTHVFVGNVPDLTQVPYFAGADPAQLEGQVAAWNQVIAQACAENGATLVDLHATWDQFGDHPEYISDDGLHPSQVGANALARMFSVAIAVSLGQSRQEKLPERARA